MAKRKKDIAAAEMAPPPKGREAFRLLTGLFFAVVSVYTLIALLSYLFTWAEDQSLLSNPEIWSTIVPVENGAGKLGFFWANFLVSKLFGLGAFTIPFLFGAIAIYALRIRKINIVKLLFLALYGAIAISLLFSFILGFTRLDDWFGSGAGGSYGYFLNKWLIGMLGAFGAGAVIFILFIVWLIFISNNVVIWLSRQIASLFKSKKGEEHIENVKTEKRGNIAEKGSETEDKVIFEIENRDNNDAKGVESESKGDSKVEKDTADDLLIIEDNDSEEEFLKNLPPGALDTLFDPRLDLSNYKIPPITLLEDYRDKIYKVPQDELEKNNRKIVKTLGDYKISIERIFARTGPTVTLYEIVPAAGVRISQIKRLEDDIALSLAARGVRIIAPIPGTNAVGIEVANDKPSVVPMRSVLEDPRFRNAEYELPIVIGRTISNEAMTFDLAKMPHLLVAGATGQGKSVGLNAIITSLLYTKHPSEMKFVLVDPKKVELSLYSKLEKHFLAKLPDTEDPIITDTQKVVYTLKSLTIEMDARYDLLKAAHVRTVKEYNEKFLSRRLNPMKGHRYMPYIVVIIDEFADLLMTAGREIEDPIARLAQLARAIGIHLVIATQRPTTNIITGLIKANFPARIAFRVISNIDSRTILDTTGANQLVGRGDMLISVGGELTRVQCAFIDTSEVEKIAEFIGSQQGYPSAHYLPEYVGEDGDANGMNDVDLSKKDKLFEEAARLVVQYQQGSTSLIQRRMNLGYNRAGRIMDQLEAAGIVGPSEGSKARQVLITDLTSLDRILASLD
jgi:DNA segregation ATPase FtsK/SpoIIIE and related proteins